MDEWMYICMDVGVFDPTRKRITLFLFGWFSFPPQKNNPPPPLFYFFWRERERDTTTISCGCLSFSTHPAYIHPSILPSSISLALLVSFTHILSLLHITHIYTIHKLPIGSSFKLIGIFRCNTFGCQQLSKR